MGSAALRTGEAGTAKRAGVAVALIEARQAADSLRARVDRMKLKTGALGLRTRKCELSIDGPPPVPTSQSFEISAQMVLLRLS
jgi:hypothetical protein